MKHTSLFRSKETEGIKIEPTLERILELLHQQKKTEREQINYLELANGSVTKWKFHNGKSYFKYIKKIAAFLGVTTDYLIYGSNDCETLTGQEIHLIKLYREMTEDDRNCLMNVAEKFCRLSV